MSSGKAPDNRGDFLPAAAAVLLFVPLLVFRRFGPVDFWWWMSLDLFLLIGLGAAVDPRFLPSVKEDIRSGTGRKLLCGAASAAVLFAVFFAGNAVSRSLFSFAGPGISAVYDFKAGTAPLRIGLLMTLVIGPGEEIFWRGFLQRRWQTRFGPFAGMAAAAALYTAVHFVTGNPMLILSAAVCGVFWGILYRKTGSVLLVAVSHTLWDLAVFLIFPFG